MTILLLGKNGQLGWELQRALAPLGTMVAVDFDECNFTEPAQIRNAVRTTRPAFIVNAAAYTAVDKAEHEPDLAHAINAAAPGILAAEAMRCGAWLIHYSTDYVFDGRGFEPRHEDALANPLSVYGRTKLAGEQAVQESGCQYLIFRTSWVFAARGGNFVKTILRLAGERDHLSIINDQIGAPTGAELLADVTAHAIRTAARRPEVSGLYHLAAGGEVSWHGYACFILETAGKLGIPLRTLPGNVKPIPTTEYPVPARRPLNSRLATHRLRDTFGLELPAWQLGVVRMLQELYEARS